ncbi:MAG: hypothetical protein ABW167_07790 [Baekduia sp.]
MSFFDGDDEVDHVHRFGDQPPVTASPFSTPRRSLKDEPEMTPSVVAKWLESAQGRIAINVVGLVGCGWLARRDWERRNTKRAFYWTFVSGECYGKLAVAVGDWSKSYKRSKAK